MIPDSYLNIFVRISKLDASLVDWYIHHDTPEYIHLHDLTGFDCYLKLRLAWSAPSPGSRVEDVDCSREFE